MIYNIEFDKTNQELKVFAYGKDTSIIIKADTKETNDTLTWYHWRSDKFDKIIKSMFYNDTISFASPRSLDCHFEVIKLRKYIIRYKYIRANTQIVIQEQYGKFTCSVLC